MKQGVRQEALATIVGKRVESATSSLTSFAIKFDDNSGVIFDAQDSSNPTVGARLATAAELPELAEAVCSVDWSWISGSKVANAEAPGSSVRLTLDAAGPLVVGAALWEGKPFLSFQPYKPAKK